MWYIKILLSHYPYYPDKRYGIFTTSGDVKAHNFPLTQSETILPIRHELAKIFIRLVLVRFRLCPQCKRN